MARRAPSVRTDARARPHRLAVYWAWTEAVPGGRGCELMVPAGVLHLNATAAAIWARLDGRRDVPAVAAALAPLYPGVDRAELTAAVDRLLAQLEALGAVVRRWTPLDPCPAWRVTGPISESGG
ncbi:MAG: PqqD family protein [Candidatus Krumholzibacteriia bacterium]